MDARIFAVLITALFIVSILCLFLFYRLFHIRARLREIACTLDDIEAGNVNHKLLVKPKDATAAICYQINNIAYQYQDRLRELETSAGANKQLMTSLSHDVRTPLTTLTGYLDAIHRGMVSGQEREDYIETARKKSHEMKAYIDILFEWFKLNSDEETLSIEPHEIGELTRNLLKDWIPVFEESNLEYEINIPECRLMAAVDTDGYIRIVNNLIQNVLAHSQAGKIKIDIINTEETVQIGVADNGVGISEEDRKYIFDRLYKVDKGRSEKGSGLGLNIVQQLTEKMGGKILVGSEPGKGTVFTLVFSLYQ